jgi:capsular polysaccharide biosynthesis protein
MSQQPNVAASTAPILSPADIWRIVRARFWLIVACFVVLGLGGTGGLVAWYVWAPFYLAEGIVEVEPGQNQFPALMGGYQPEIPTQLFQSYVEAQVLAIKNPRVLDAALKELEGKQTLYTGAGAILNISEDLRVMYIPNTQNILVSLKGRHREEVTQIVTQILTQYTAQIKDDPTASANCAPSATTCAASWPTSAGACRPCAMNPASLSPTSGKANRWPVWWPLPCN